MTRSASCLQPRAQNLERAEPGAGARRLKRFLRCKAPRGRSPPAPHPRLLPPQNLAHPALPPRTGRRPNPGGQARREPPAATRLGTAVRHREPPDQRPDQLCGRIRGTAELSGVWTAANTPAPSPFPHARPGSDGDCRCRRHHAAQETPGSNPSSGTPCFLPSDLRASIRPARSADCPAPPAGAHGEAEGPARAVGPVTGP